MRTEQDTNMSPGAVGVRSVNLLQNKYCILNVAVHEVNQEVGAANFPPHESLDW